MFYKYNTITGKYEGQVETAYYTPDGKLLSGYTKLEPPTISDGKELYFENNQWVLKDKPVDYRGTWVNIDGDTVSITQLGETPPDGYAKEKDGIWYFANGSEATDITLKQLKQRKINQLKTDFNNLPNLGFHSQTIDKTINAKYTDLLNMKSLLAYMTKNNLSTVKFRCFDNSFVDITQAQLQSMIDELIDYGIQCYNKKWQIEQAINQATTIDKLKSIQWDKQLNLIQEG